MNRAFNFTRRRLLLTATAAAGSIVLSAHTPYSQWSVYRQKHLLILTSREDALSYDLGKALAELLAEYLPASAARVTRAPSLDRVASLLSTHQLDLALIDAGHARSLFKGEKPFETYVDVPLRSLFALGHHVLITLSDFQDRHAYQVAETLDLNRRDLPATTVAPAELVPEIPLHPGAVAYFSGRPLPDSVSGNEPAKED